MITKLTTLETLNIKLISVWHDPRKRGAVIRQIRRLKAAA